LPIITWPMNLVRETFGSATTTLLALRRERKVKVTRVTQSKVSSYMIGGLGQRDMNNVDWKWCHDFVSHPRLVKVGRH
jgi:hypothetical protein